MGCQGSKNICSRKYEHPAIGLCIQHKSYLPLHCLYWFFRILQWSTGIFEVVSIFLYRLKIVQKNFCPIFLPPHDKILRICVCINIIGDALCFSVDIPPVILDISYQKSDAIDCTLKLKIEEQNNICTYFGIFTVFRWNSYYGRLVYVQIASWCLKFGNSATLPTGNIV